MATDDGDPDGEPLIFDCPRCGATARMPFYGPCEPCRDELRATLGREGTEGEVLRTAYEPRMHVVPNAVALKD